MAEEQQNGGGRILPKLDRVQRGDAITAEAWNQIVDAINKPVDVSLRRPRRKAPAAKGTAEEITVLTGVSVDSSGNLVFSIETKKFLVEA